MNVIKDVIFEGEILKMVTDAVVYLDTQTQEKIHIWERRSFCNGRRIFEICPEGNYCKCNYASGL